MPGSLKIKSIQFASGPAIGEPPLQISPNNLVILVGPNNSGKSVALREIESLCLSGGSRKIVVENLDIDLPIDIPGAQSILQTLEISAPQGHVANANHIWIWQHSIFGEQVQKEINIEQLVNIISRDPNDAHVKTELVKHFTIRLDGRTRFALAEPKQAGDLQLHPQNHLWKLFVDNIARAEVRRLTADAFGLYFVIDPTGMMQFKIRMSSRPPVNDAEEQSLDQTSRNFHSSAPIIQEFSDGVQAFVGLISALLSLPHKILLIDEPEAFLHPPLARRLGSNLSHLITVRDGSLITATHSADFVMGCLETTANVVVVRLTYEGGVATARMLPAADLNQITKDPLLRSTGTLRALFHRAVIVTESEADRAFYDEINNRLLQNARGIKDALFINAQNKQTIRRIVRPLRKIGIPAIAIVDMDIIRGAKDFRELLTDCQVPAATIINLEIERVWLFRRLQQIAPLGGGDPLKNGGTTLLIGADFIRASTLFTTLNSYGIFAIPSGEIETWLPAVGAHGHGTQWLIDMFTKIGQTPADANYVNPANNDVWRFLDDISVWVENPARLGV
jgi:energy-coupling factor transporter ATP-binding protein EcfA2